MIMAQQEGHPDPHVFLALIAGVALYNGVFKSVPLKKMLLGAMLLGVALGSTQVRRTSHSHPAAKLMSTVCVTTSRQRSVLCELNACYTATHSSSACTL